MALLNERSDAPSRISLGINGKMFILSGAALFCMVVPTVLDILSRAIVNHSLIGSLELVSFAQVFLVIGSLGLIQDRESHIHVTLLTDKMPEWARDSLRIFHYSSSFVFICLTTYSLYLQGMMKYSSGETSDLLHWPLYCFYFVSFLGSVAFSVSLFAAVWRVVHRLLSQKNVAAVGLGFILSGLMLLLALNISELPICDDLRMLGALGLLFLMVLILLACPIGLAMGMVGYIGMQAIYPGIESSLAMLGSGVYSTISNYGFCIVPMYILMGELAKHSGISRDLFSAASVWFGRLPGGMTIAAMTGCAGFAAVSGDSMATAVSMGSVALPEMKKKNYHTGLSCATLAAGGTLGILIPPSTGFIFYSLVTETSIGKLFVAGIVPGILLTCLFILTILSYAFLNPNLAPGGQATSFREKLQALNGVVVMIGLVIVILGGILTGIFTPSEGGAAGAAVTLLYSVIRRKLSWDGFLNAVSTTVMMTSELFLVLIGVNLLGYFFAATALPFDLADMVVGLECNRYVILLAIVVFYIVMGCLLNVIPMILLTLPAIFPTIVKLDFDPVWFGVVVVILMEMGQITPPVGINVFAMYSVAPEVSLASIFRKIIPFFLCMLGLVFILTVFPEIALWLPGILF